MDIPLIDKTQSVLQTMQNIEYLSVQLASRQLNKVGGTSDPVTDTATIDWLSSRVRLIKSIQTPPGGLSTVPSTRGQSARPTEPPIEARWSIKASESPAAGCAAGGVSLVHTHQISRRFPTAGGPLSLAVISSQIRPTSAILVAGTEMSHSSWGNA